MALERLAPDTLALQDNLSGTVADIQDDPDSADANWLTAVDQGTDTDARVTLPSPSGNPSTGPGLQEFRVLVRKDATGGNDPTYEIELWENGVLVSSLAGPTALTDADGELVVSVTWDASLLSNADGSGVECRVHGVKPGGPPNSRRAVEVGAIEWNADVVSADVLVDASAVSMTVAEQPAVVSLDANVMAGTDALVLSTAAASVVLGVDVAATTAALVVSEHAANPSLDVNIGAGLDALTTTVFPASVSLGIDVAAGSKALLLTEMPANIEVDTDLQAGIASLVLATFAAMVALDVDVRAGTDALSLTPLVQDVALDVVVVVGSPNDINQTNVVRQAMTPQANPKKKRSGLSYGGFSIGSKH